MLGCSTGSAKVQTQVFEMSPDLVEALPAHVGQSQQGRTEWNMLMAASTLAVLPIIGLFFLTQKTLIQGITMTGLKG